jgi:hypothetical protein
VQSDLNGGKDNLFDAVKEHLTAKLYRVRRNEPEIKGSGLMIIGEDRVVREVTENEMIMKEDEMSVRQGAVNVERGSGQSMNIVPDKKRERIGLLSKFKNKAAEKKISELVESTESVESVQAEKSVNSPVEDNTEFDDVKSLEFGSANTDMDLSSDLFLIHRCYVIWFLDFSSFDLISFDLVLLVMLFFVLF